MESFETGRNFDFQMERNTNQLARGAFLLFKTPSFWTYDNETTRHTLDDFLQRSRPQGRGGRKMNTTVQKAIHDGMKATGITQTELAVVLRSRARASEIINGKRDLRRTELLVLSYLLHIPLETLMPPLSEEDKLHIDSLIAWERKLQETRYIKKRTSKRSKESCPKN